jgi:hypothetical protein
MDDANGIPKAGRNLVLVAAVKNVLHFRVFDNEGKLALDTDEEILAEGAQRVEDLELVRQIEDFRRQLVSLWPPHQLTRNEKDRGIAALASINAHGLRITIKVLREGLSSFWPPHRLTRSEKDSIIDDVTSILRFSPFNFPSDNTMLVTITSQRKDGQMFCRDFLKALESKLKEVPPVLPP